MGVPITLLDKYNPEQFEIIGSDDQVIIGEISFLLKSTWEGKSGGAFRIAFGILSAE